MPTALVTGSAELVPDILIALKSAGFDILSVRDSGPGGLPTIVVGEAPASDESDEMASLAGESRPEPISWWSYAEIDGELGFANWRDSILCLASQQSH